MATGSIPLEIIYVFHYEDEYVLDVEGIRAHSVFPVSSTSSSMLETALSWAKGYRWSIDKPKIQQEVLVNSGIAGVRLVDLEKREEGGRAYKVIYRIGDNWVLVDLREDALMDVIRLHGIRKGGYLNGEFIWAQIGAQMRFIVVDSPIHREVVGLMNRKNLKKIKSSDLVFGHLYENATGACAVYLGRCSSCHLELEKRIDYRSTPPMFSVHKRIDTLAWYNVSDYDIKDGMINWDDIHAYQVSFTKSHSYRTDKGNVVKSEITQAELLQRIRENAVSRLFDSKRSSMGGAAGTAQQAAWYKEDVVNHLAYYSSTSSICPADEDPTLHKGITAWVSAHPMHCVLINRMEVTND